MLHSCRHLQASPFVPGDRSSAPLGDRQAPSSRARTGEHRGDRMDKSRGAVGRADCRAQRFLAPQAQCALPVPAKRRPHLGRARCTTTAASCCPRLGATQTPTTQQERDWNKEHGPRTAPHAPRNRPRLGPCHAPVPTPAAHTEAQKLPWHIQAPQCGSSPPSSQHTAR